MKAYRKLKSREPKSMIWSESLSQSTAKELLGSTIPLEIEGNSEHIICSRKRYRKGKVNNKFQQFADDYGFKVRPFIAGRPNTKAKDEESV